MQFGLLLDPETSLSYSDLNSLVHTMRSEHPEIGETIVWGRLRSLGYRVTRERVRLQLSGTTIEIIQVQHTCTDKWLLSYYILEGRILQLRNE